jgi:hypothetical protein
MEKMSQLPFDAKRAQQLHNSTRVERRHQQRLNYVLTPIFVCLILLSAICFYFPTESIPWSRSGEPCPHSLTVEQRAERILAENPLIGVLSPLIARKPSSSPQMDTMI